MLLIYYLAFLVVADSLAGTQTASAAITPVTFTEEEIDPASTAPARTHTKTVGDIDGDGLADVLVGGAGKGDTRNGLYWYKNPTGTANSWVDNKFPIVDADPDSSGFSTDMQVGDVDGDGDLDVVIPRADFGGNIGETIKWFENPGPLGNPETDPWVEHHVGIAPAHDVELGDLNNDGRLDIVVRYRQVNVFLQGVVPDTWTRIQVDTRFQEGLALSDWDDDGDIDLATNGYWLENPFIPGGEPAMNSIWTEHVIDTGRNDTSKAFASDIDLDGVVDVVIGTSETSGGELAWYEPSGAGAKGGPWTKHPIGFVDYDHSIQTGDMDLDGDIDVVVAEMHQSANSRVIVFYNLDGAGTSWDSQIIDTDGSHNLRVVDIENDGDLDIVGANWSTGPISLWRNNGPAPLDNWERHLVDANRPWRAVLLDSADIDNDGLVDVVTGGWWYKNPGSPGGAWVQNTIGAPLNNMALVYDFDGDNDLDILGTEGQGAATNSNLVWAENDGSGGFTIHNNVPAGTGDFLQGVAVGQITGAQTEIYLSWHLDFSSIQQLLVPADPVSTPWTFGTPIATSQQEDLSQGDIDNDLDIDLLLGTQWLENTPGGWVANDLFLPAGMPDRNELADINGDGDLDAVVGYEAISVAGTLAWYEQGATPTDLWTEHVISNTIIGPMSMDVRDMDGDGDFDVVAGEHNLVTVSAARLIVYENLDGVGGTWAEHVVYTGDEHHDGARTVDIDSDGDIDIVSIGWKVNPGGVFLYENKSGVAVGKPIAAPDSYGATEDTLLNVAAPGVLDNDSDPDSDPMTAVLVAGASNGTVNLNSDGSFTYDPDQDFNGVDSFTYEASDSVNNSVTTTVTLNVAAVNDVPVATAQSVTAESKTARSITLTGTDADGDSLSFTVTVQPLNGLLSGTSPNLFYTSDAAYTGPDSFEFTAFDGTVPSPAATVTLSVVPPNAAPVGVPDSYLVDEDSVLNVTAPGVLGNDTDAEFDPLTAQLISGPTNGALTFNSDGSFDYTPVGDFHGQDSFTYQAVDLLRNSATTTVTITVDPINDEPVANPQTVPVDENTSAPITLTASDADSDSLSFNVTTQPVNGLLTGVAPTLTFTPNNGYSGADSFTFTASDASSTSPSVIVQIDVTGLNSGLLGRWTFDDGSGVDSSGNGNNGVVTGAALAAGQIGAGSLDFDGTDGHVDLGNLDVTGSNVTVAAWVNADDFSTCVSSDCRIFSKASGTNESDHYLMISPVNSTGVKLRFRLKAGGSTQTLIASTGNMTTGQWMHIAASYDGVNMRLYLDGVEVGSIAKTGTIDAGPTVPMWIGGNPPDATSRPWDGKIDDVRLYGRTLSLAEIQQLAAGQVLTVTVSGTISLFGIVTGTTAFLNADPRITLDSGAGIQTVSVASDGSFALNAVDGTYTITASAPGYISKQRLGQVIAGANITMPAVQLIPGLVDQDLFVTGADLSLVLGGLGAALVGRTNGVDSNIIDVNADGVVNGLDPSLVGNSIGLSSPETDW